MTIYSDASPDKLCIVTDKVMLKDFSGTSNEAEYAAIIWALDVASDGDLIFSDSKLIVNQINGEWKIKAKNLFPFYIKAREIFASKDIILKWISRDYNKAGLILE